jgi:hypothetical protein
MFMSAVENRALKNMFRHEKEEFGRNGAIKRLFIPRTPH